MLRSLAPPACHTSEQNTTLTIVQCQTMARGVTIIRCADSSENPHSPALVHTHTHQHRAAHGPSTVTITLRLAYVTGHATDVSPIRHNAAVLMGVRSEILTCHFHTASTMRDTKNLKQAGGGLRGWSSSLSVEMLLPSLLLSVLL